MSSIRLQVSRCKYQDARGIKREQVIAIWNFLDNESMNQWITRVIEELSLLKRNQKGFWNQTNFKIQNKSGKKYRLILKNFWSKEIIVSQKCLVAKLIFYAKKFLRENLVKNFDKQILRKKIMTYNFFCLNKCMSKNKIDSKRSKNFWPKNLIWQKM